MITTDLVRVRVLVADDDPDHRFFILRGLRRFEGVEFDVDTVEDGEQALAYLRGTGAYHERELPHLVLLDLRMPKVNGHEVLAELKSDPQLRAIPVVVLSSSARPDDIDRAYDLGTNSYVVKAASASEVSDALEKVSEFWTGVARLPGLR